MSAEPISARIYPAGILTMLSRMEVERLHDASRGKLGELLRRCALAVLNSGNEGDDAEALMQRHKDFEIEVQQVNRGIRLELSNAPGSAFVDGIMVQGIRELLSAVIRDLAPQGLFVVTRFEASQGTGVTVRIRRPGGEVWEIQAITARKADGRAGIISGRGMGLVIDEAPAGFHEFFEALRS